MERKNVVFSQHALEQLTDRSATKEEVKLTIYNGEQIPAKKGRIAFRKNFPFHSDWKGKHYEIKQIVPIVKEETEKYTVVTVYVFYFGGEEKK